MVNPIHIGFIPNPYPADPIHTRSHSNSKRPHPIHIAYITSPYRADLAHIGAHLNPYRASPIQIGPDHISLKNLPKPTKKALRTITKQDIEVLKRIQEKGSKILIEEFPDQDDIENTKETIEKI